MFIPQIDYWNKLHTKIAPNFEQIKKYFLFLMQPKIPIYVSMLSFKSSVLQKCCYKIITYNLLKDISLYLCASSHYIFNTE